MQHALFVWNSELSDNIPVFDFFSIQPILCLLFPSLWKPLKMMMMSSSLVVVIRPHLPLLLVSVWFRRLQLSVVQLKDKRRPANKQRKRRHCLRGTARRKDNLAKRKNNQ